MIGARIRSAVRPGSWPVSPGGEAVLAGGWQVNVSVLPTGRGRVEVAAATTPDTAIRGAGGRLGRVEAAHAVEGLPVVAVDVGPAAAELGQFQAAAVYPCVGEDAPVDVFATGHGVVAEHDGRAFGGEAVHRARRRPGAALDRGPGLHVLGAVDADESDVGEVAVGLADPQRVAVDRVGDRRAEDAGRAAPRAGDACLRQERDQGDREGENRAGAGSVHRVILTGASARYAKDAARPGASVTSRACGSGREVSDAGGNRPSADRRGATLSP